MKRSPLKRKTPLRRSGPIKRKPPKRLSREGSDPARLAFVRTLDCYMRQVYPPAKCEGRIHAHHAIHRSQGGKDDAAVPLCMKHHRQWHDHSGVFRGLDRLSRFSVAQGMIAATQKLYEGRE